MPPQSEEAGSSDTSGSLGCHVGLEISKILCILPTITSCFKAVTVAGVPKQLELKLAPDQGCLIMAEEHGKWEQSEGRE